MDETNGTRIFDSYAPFRDAEYISDDSNFSRVDGFLGNSLFFDGSSRSVNLDANGTGFLEQSFLGRTVSMWLKSEESFYTGPKDSQT